MKFNLQFKKQNDLSQTWSCVCDLSLFLFPPLFPFRFFPLFPSVSVFLFVFRIETSDFEHNLFLNLVLQSLSLCLSVALSLFVSAVPLCLSFCLSLSVPVCLCMSLYLYNSLSVFLSLSETSDFEHNLFLNVVRKAKPCFK